MWLLCLAVSTKYLNNVSGDSVNELDFRIMVTSHFKKICNVVAWVWVSCVPLPQGSVYPIPLNLELQAVVSYQMQELGIWTTVPQKRSKYSWTSNTSPLKARNFSLRQVKASRSGLHIGLRWAVMIWSSCLSKLIFLCSESGILD